MTKRLRTIVYGAAGLLLASSLALLPASSQARYTLPQTWWQAAYQSPDAALWGDYLSAEGSVLLLEDWTPPESGGTREVMFQVTSALPIAPPAEAEEADANALTVSVNAVGGVVTAAASYIVTGEGTATVTVTLTASPVQEKTTAEVNVQIAHGDAALLGTLRVPLLPQQTEPDFAEPQTGSLFKRDAAMTQYDPRYPFCVAYTLPEGSAEGELSLNGEPFPPGTRYSQDGVTYTTLYRSRTLPVTGSRVFIDLAGAAQDDLTLTLRAGAAQDTLTVQSALRGDGDAVFAENGVPTLTLHPWNNDCLTVKATVEQLAWVEEPLPSADPSAQETPATRRTVQYTSAPVRCEWTPVSDAGAGDADLDTQPQTLTLLPQEGASRIPAGTYRLRVCWTLGDAIVTERVIPFFVTY